MKSLALVLLLLGSVTFEEVPPQTSKITWVHNNAQSADRQLPETVGAGCAFLDYDNDGWLDIYFVNSGPSDFFTPTTPLKNALYHNNHDGTFTDVTDRAGVAGGKFGMGVAAGDFDGDGFVDLYITNYGSNILYHNNGNGTFTDVTDKAGVAAPGWSTCAVWFDYNNDGKLDLFVSSFVFYDKSQNPLCTDPTLQRRYYCVPRLFKPMPSHLFRNNGNGTFTEVGLAGGVAYGEAGRPRSGMGVDAADYDGDGWQDLFVANIDHEFFSLYHNDKELIFTDQPGEIAPSTHLLSGWGLKFFDYDNDGDPDLFLVNGHPDDMIESRIARVRYKEPLLLFENTGKGLKDVSATSGAVFGRVFSGRGMAVGDFDNDGDLDVLVSNNGEAPLLLRNQGGNKNNWIGLTLVATKSNPAAVGAVITWQAGGVKRTRLRTSGGSYLSSHDPREILGLGTATKIDSIEIRWPSGTTDKLTNVPLNKYIKVVEGAGQSR